MDRWAWKGQRWQDCQDMTMTSGEHLTRWPGQGSCNWTAGTGQPGQERRVRTDGSGQMGQDRQVRTDGSGQTGQDRASWTGRLGPENWDRTAETGWTWQVGLIGNLDRAARTLQYNVWKTYIFVQLPGTAKIFFMKMFLKKLIFIYILHFINIFAKMIGIPTFRENFRLSRKCLRNRKFLWTFSRKCLEHQNFAKTVRFVKRNLARTLANF
jgi:hypothetical protein